MCKSHRVGAVILPYRVKGSADQVIADVPRSVGKLLSLSRLLFVSGFALLLLPACSTQDPGGPPRQPGVIYSRVQGSQFSQASGSNVVGTSLRLDQPGEAAASMCSLAIPRGVAVDLESPGLNGVYPKVTIYARCQYDNKWTQLVRTTIVGHYRAYFPFMGSHQTTYNVRIVYDGTEPIATGFPPLLVHEVKLDD